METRTVSTKKTAEGNNNEMRMAKYEMLVEDVDRALSHNYFPGFGIVYSVQKLHESENTTISPLEMIFDRDEVNDYGRIILDKATILFTESDDRARAWYNEHADVLRVDNKHKIAAAKDFVGYCRKDPSNTGYKFIFWSLMLLSVDDFNADNNITLICDFAKMMGISDDELVEIAHVIKYIYYEIEQDEVLTLIKTDTIKNVFGKVIRMNKA